MFANSMTASNGLLSRRSDTPYASPPYCQLIRIMSHVTPSACISVIHHHRGLIRLNMHCRICVTRDERPTPCVRALVPNTALGVDCSRRASYIVRAGGRIM